MVIFAGVLVGLGFLSLIAIIMGAVLAFLDRDLNTGDRHSPFYNARKYKTEKVKRKHLTYKVEIYHKNLEEFAVRINRETITPFYNWVEDIQEIPRIVNEFIDESEEQLEERQNWEANRRLELMNLNITDQEEELPKRRRERS